MKDGHERGAARTSEARAAQSRPTAARQLDAFAGHDVRGVAKQLDLFCCAGTEGFGFGPARKSTVTLDL